MSGLLYRQDMDEVRRRLTAWWNGEDLGRPMIQLYAPRSSPAEDVDPMPAPEGWGTHYSTKSFEYRVYLSRTACVGTQYLGEAVPVVAPDLAPNCLALFLGCQGVEMPDTVWCRPCMEDPGSARFDLDWENFYWQFATRLGREQLRIGQGRFLIQFPDLIEGLDTLAAMRGTENLLVDLLERPEWVHACLRQITDRYFACYDRLYELLKDETGGSCFWAWAPGRLTKLQCDFSAMISPEMFGQFMVPVLLEMTERVSHSLYHWDGPGAIGHLDHLLNLPKLNMIQWTPGAGQPAMEDVRWWPLYHRILDAGKKAFIMGISSSESVRAMRREFGRKFNQCLLSAWVPGLREADEILRAARA